MLYENIRGNNIDRYSLKHLVQGILSPLRLSVKILIGFATDRSCFTRRGT